MPDYDLVTFVDGAGGATPLNALNLNKIKTAVANLNLRAQALEEINDVLVYDSFDRANGALTTTDTGQAWEAQAGTFTVSTNKATSVIASTYTVDAGATDVEINCDITVAASGAPGLIVRALNDANNHFAVQLDAVNGFVINRRVANVLNTMATSPQVFTNGVTYRVWVRVINDVIMAYLDGTLRLVYNMSTSDVTTLGAATRVGLRYNTTTPGITWDSFVVRRVGNEVAAAIPIDLQTASYTLTLSDSGKAVEMDSASATTLTVPPNSTAPFPIGSIIEIARVGAGAVTIAAGAGVTLRSASGLVLRAQYSSASIRKRGVDEWIVAGDVTT